MWRSAGVEHGREADGPKYGAAQGYTTFTLDDRGIGLSRPDTLKGFRMQYLDWAHHDLAAAVDLMSDPALPLFMVGHSLLPGVEPARHGQGPAAGRVPRLEALVPVPALLLRRSRDDPCGGAVRAGDHADHREAGSGRSATWALS
jgi:hypothetical protein